MELSWPEERASKPDALRLVFQRGFYQLIFGLCVYLCWGGMWGCSDERGVKQTPYLLRVGDCLAHKDDFEAAFEALSAGWDIDGEADSTNLTSLKLRVLDQLAEELLLCRHAKELNLYVTPAELDNAVEKIKAQYPPGIFEEIMLEHAVPFNVWKRRLNARLLMMLVIETELVNELDITYDDAARFLKDPLSGSATDAQTPDNSKSRYQEAEVLGRLRRYQSEQAYGQWLETLKNRYKVQWNKSEIKKVIDQNPD